MAITAAIAGPICNVALGSGLANAAVLLNNKKCSLSETYISFSIKGDGGHLN